MTIQMIFHVKWSILNILAMGSWAAIYAYVVLYNSNKNINIYHLGIVIVVHPTILRDAIMMEVIVVNNRVWTEVYNSDTYLLLFLL